MDPSKPPRSEHSWFPGFAWQAVSCGGCSPSRLLGWAFTPIEGRSSEGFFGLVVTRLRDRPMEAEPHNIREVTTTPLFRSCADASSGGCAGPLAAPRTRRMRGLSASTVSAVTSPAASAAARGMCGMPAQMLPSTAKCDRRPFPHAEENDASCSSDESEEFQEQRRNRKHESLSIELAPPTALRSNCRKPQPRYSAVQQVEVGRGLGLEQQRYRRQPALPKTATPMSARTTMAPRPPAPQQPGGKSRPRRSWSSGAAAKGPAGASSVCARCKLIEANCKCFSAAANT
eukprot:gnl/TRDRNA2_/TRDRNA2_44163_c1_seq1.p1 gnl/TRDRNA2_/TRDRNA2_44163_c1~~gnl/TRDRNA2_/TRDRNA2_44163_c1_seq1.p1  ORF type:complete len:323 (+),score=20.83 gnl/TRDRNA2_/TRDRNA2_44163_c1_seq1:110-970(+)